MPNRTVAAADEGLPTPRRRSDDAKLIALGRRFAAARGVIEEYNQSPDEFPDSFDFPDLPIMEKMIPLKAETLAGRKVKARALLAELRERGKLVDTLELLAMSLATDVISITDAAEA